MSVPKSKRSEPKAKFLQDVFNVRKKTLEVLKKFPKGYKFNLSARIAELADTAYWATVEGNSVYMSEKMFREDYMYRRRCFMKAYTSLRALTAEASFCYRLVMEGNNFFEDASVRDKTFALWTSMCKTAVKSVKTILDSDKRRYNAYAKSDNPECTCTLEDKLTDILDRLKTQIISAIMER